jgi:predicted outer membrane repeat protein
MHVVASSVTMNNCTVDGHIDCELGGGLYISDESVMNINGGVISANTAKTNGGGLYMTGGSLNLHGTEISDNGKLATSTFMNGGGLFVTAASVAVDSTLFSGNTGDLGGGALYDACTDVAISNSIVHGNTASYFGGGQVFQNVVSGSFTGNTVVENSGTLSGASGLHVIGAAPEISNNIIAFNTGGSAFANGVNVPSEPAVFTCNDVYSNGVDFGGMADPTGTNGNISADPLFCDLAAGKFGVSDSSPCAPENSGGCELIGALAAGCGESAVPGESGGIPVAFHVDQNYPNPFNPATKIRFALPAEGLTEVVIYNVAGQRVKTLVKEVLPAQVHEVVWTGRDDAERAVAAGVYFYRVTSGGNTSVGRMALVK